MPKYILEILDEDNDIEMLWREVDAEYLPRKGEGVRFPSVGVYDVTEVINYYDGRLPLVTVGICDFEVKALSKEGWSESRLQLY